MDDNTYLISDINRFKATIRNSQGKPIYIPDNTELALQLADKGVDNIYLLDTAYNQLAGDKLEAVATSHFGKPLEARDTDSPVIILSTFDKGLVKFTDKVYEILTKANISLCILILTDL